MFLRLSRLIKFFLHQAQGFLEVIFPPRRDERIVRSIRYSQLKQFATSGLFENTKITSLLSYRSEIVKAVIREAKFERNRHAQMLLGKLLAEYCIETLIKTSSKDKMIMIIPLPLGEKRLKERGYNQVEEICRYSLPYFKENNITAVLQPELLQRTRETKQQTSLGRTERLKNMQNAFKVTAPLNPTYLYIVVDDVLTTGATLSAAMDAFQATHFKESTGSPQILAISLAK
jgi:ComF family protein